MVIILAGMLAFALLHSLTADARVKQWFIQRFGDRSYHGLYRLIYNGFAVLCLAPIMLSIWNGGKIMYAVSPPLESVFFVLQLAGSIGLVISLLQIDIWRFAGIRQLIAYIHHDPLPLPPEKLQTGGLYALVRHPLYLFSLMSLWFISPMTDTMFWFNIAATLYFVIGSQIEERRMVTCFGKEYIVYQARVPWLLPVPRFVRAIKL